MKQTRKTLHLSASSLSYVVSDGNIQKTQLEAFRQFITAPNNAPSKKQLERLLALNQLMNIAYYYNNCKYIEKGHMISYNKEQECYEVIGVGNAYYKLGSIEIYSLLWLINLTA